MKIDLILDVLIIFGGISGILSWIVYDPATDSVIIMKALCIVSLLMAVLLFIVLTHKKEKGVL